MFNETLAALLSEHTWMSRVAIENTLRNYGYANNGGTPFTVKARGAGNTHYQAYPVPGGWHVRPWRLGVSTQVLSEMLSLR